MVRTYRLYRNDSATLVGATVVVDDVAEQAVMSHLDEVTDGQEWHYGVVTVEDGVESAPVWDSAVAPSGAGEPGDWSLDWDTVAEMEAWYSANTGPRVVLDESEMTTQGPNSGSRYQITTDGAVYEDVIFNANVRVMASNVIVRRCIINGRVFQEEGFGADNFILEDSQVNFSGLIPAIDNEASGRMTVRYCRANGQQSGDATAMIGGSDMWAHHNEIYDTTDGFQIGSRGLYEYNWVHRIEKWGGGGHPDCFQFNGGQNEVIVRRNFGRKGLTAKHTIVIGRTTKGPLADIHFIENYVDWADRGWEWRHRSVAQNADDVYPAPTRCNFISNRIGPDIEGSTMRFFSETGEDEIDCSPDMYREDNRNWVDGTLETGTGDPGPNDPWPQTWTHWSETL